MKTGYSSTTEGAVALAASTAKSVIGVKGNAAFGVDWIGYRLGFDNAASAGTVAVAVELCYATFATNSPGTNSTGTTIRTIYGRAVASGMAAAKNWTTEPTVLTVFDEFFLPPSGVIVPNFPRDRTPDSAFAEGFVIRCTAAAIVNLRAGLYYERA